MTSYRGDEAIDWFGFSRLWSQIVEPDRGLCGNHKPNRFFESKKNA